MKVAVIGVGNMGSKYVKKLDLLNIDTILVDKDQNKLKKQPDKFKKYTDLDKALKENNIDYAFIATDPNSHIPIAKKLLERKINVMVEKPPATKPKPLDEAIELALKNNVVLSISEIELKSSSVRNLKLDMDIHQIEAYRLNLGKGYINPFFDLAWHDLYILHYLFGDFNIKSVKNLDKTIKVEGYTKRQDFKIEVAWEYPSIRREWLLINNKSKVKLDFLQDSIIYPDNLFKSKEKYDKLEMMIKEFLNNPSFNSSFRALEILKEFDKNRLTL